MLPRRTKVWVRADEARRGSIPARGARTGERCIARHLVGASDLPPALEWSTWSGLWPRRPDRPLPEAVLGLLPRAARLRTWLTRLRDLTAALIGVLALIAVFGSGAVQSAAVRALLAVVVVKVVVAVAGLLLTVHVRADHTGRWVLLSGVHPELAEAIEATMTRPSSPPSLTAPEEPEAQEGATADGHAEAA